MTCSLAHSGHICSYISTEACVKPLLETYQWHLAETETETVSRIEKAGPFDCWCSHQSVASPSLCLCQGSRWTFWAHSVMDSWFNVFSSCWINFCICGFYCLTVFFVSKLWLVLNVSACNEWHYTDDAADTVTARLAIIIIIIITTMIMVLSSWQSHCESSFDECRMASSSRRPKTKPDDLGCESACTGCQKLHPPSPFIIITQLESWYSFYRPTEGRRLSRSSWPITYQDGLPVQRRSPILGLTGSDVAQLRWSRPTRYH